MTGAVPTDSLLYDAHHRPGTRAYRIAQGIIWVSIGIAMLIMLAEVSIEIPESAKPYFLLLDRIILVVFGVDVVLQVATYRPPELQVFRGSEAWRLQMHIWGRVRYLFTPLVMIDVITVLALVPALRGLRALRLLRLLKGVRFFRYASPVRDVVRSLGENRLLYQSTFGIFLGVVALSGMSLYFIEGGENPGVQSVGDGIWWSLVTITTVGFGDVTPVTAAGRVLAGVVMVFGMFTLALFAGLVSSTILTIMFRLREEQFRMSTHVNHIIVCGYDDGSRLLLDSILDEQTGEQEVLLFAPRERPTDTPSEFQWIRGDPTKESELDKVKLAYADAVIVVAARDKSVQEADATTILTLFTIRAYVAKQKVNERRERPLYIIAEILDAENVEHAHAAGADEVIETTRLGFSLMAHSVKAHGSGQVMSSVASAGAASIYVGRAPLTGTAAYGDVQQEIHQRHGVTVMGVKDERGQLVLNPPDETPIEPGTPIVYLASREVLDPA